jgi:ABC-type Zn uptake system ZnuABC Zn-binding protein ZnuA
MRAAAAVGLMVGCGLLVFWGVVTPRSIAEPLRVVTTVAPLTDMVQQVGHGVLHLHGLVPEGVNSHTFQPAPGDVKYLAEADVIILNGLYLEVPIEKLASSSGKPGSVVVKLGDQTIHRDQWLFDNSFPEATGHPNPHLWLNVAYAITYVTLIQQHLSTLDLPNQAVYAQNAERYHAHLLQLDRCIVTAIATIPPAQRQLLTYHDSWPYFARRYGMTVIGAIQPASFSEPSSRYVARIIDQIRATKLPAIFGSEVFPSPVLEKIAAETSVRYIETLRDDVLPGVPGEARHSYIGMMLANVTTMVQALGGDTTGFLACTASLQS